VAAGYIDEATKRNWMALSTPRLAALMDEFGEAGATLTEQPIAWVDPADLDAEPRWRGLLDRGGHQDRR